MSRASSHGVVPAWMNEIDVAPQRQFSVPDLDDLARLALRRAYERARDGDVGLRDLAAVLR